MLFMFFILFMLRFLFILVKQWYILSIPTSQPPTLQYKTLTHTHKIREQCEFLWQFFLLCVCVCVYLWCQQNLMSLFGSAISYLMLSWSYYSLASSSCCLDAKELTGEIGYRVVKWNRWFYYGIDIYKLTFNSCLFTLTRLWCFPFSPIFHFFTYFYAVFFFFSFMFHCSNLKRKQINKWERITWKIPTAIFHFV